MDGLLLINKNSGISSHNAVKQVREIFGVRKAGHFGTLDPMAKGLLLIGTGNVTKFFDFYIKGKKRYAGIIEFGHSTTTYDCEGDITGDRTKIDLNKIDMDKFICGFRGKIDQVPPIYSAKKHKGQPLYKYARKNIQVDILPRTVEIFSLYYKIISKTEMSFEAETSAGTYIRSLANDIGAKVGCGAFLKELERTGIGSFSVEDAISLKELKELKESNVISKSFIPIESLLTEFPRIVVNHEGMSRTLNGAPVTADQILKISSESDSGHYRIFDDDGNLLAISDRDKRLARFNPFLVFNNRS